MIKMLTASSLSHEQVANYLAAILSMDHMLYLIKWSRYRNKPPLFQSPASSSHIIAPSMLALCCATAAGDLTTQWLSRSMTERGGKSHGQESLVSDLTILGSHYCLGVPCKKYPVRDFRSSLVLDCPVIDLLVDELETLVHFDLPSIAPEEWRMTEAKKQLDFATGRPRMQSGRPALTQGRFSLQFLSFSSIHVILRCSSIFGLDMKCR